MNRVKLLKLARTNTSLSDIQRQSLQEALSKLQQEAKPVSRSLRARTTTKSSKHESERASTAAIYSSLLHAPIRRLPLELLSEIFSFACVGDSLTVLRAPTEYRSQWQIEDDPPTAYTLIKVCKYWRDLGFKTPAVWNHPIVVDDSHYHSLARWNHILKFYGPRLTHVNIQIYGRLKKIKNMSIPETLKSLLKLQDQFTALQIPRLDAEFVNALTDGPPMVNLKEFTLSWGSRKIVTEDRFPLILPNLEHVHLKDSYVPLPSPPSTWGIPWMKLTRLTLTFEEWDIRYHMLLDSLRGLPNLDRLRLELTRALDTVDGAPSTQPIVMKRLRTLELMDLDLALTSNNFQPHHPASHFLSVLSTPALTNFEIIFQQPSDPDDERTRRMPESCTNVAEFLQQAPQLASAMVLLSPRCLLGGTFDGNVYEVLDATGLAEDFSNLTPEIDNDGDTPLDQLSSSFKQFRCLKVEVPVNKNHQVTMTFLKHLIEPGDSYLRPSRGKLPTEWIAPLTRELPVYKSLQTVVEILRSPAGDVHGERVARVIWGSGLWNRKAKNHNPNQYQGTVRLLV